MILVDTGPLVALFDRKDGQHQRCVTALRAVREPMRTTIPVLTEAFHMLGPGTIGSDRLRDFVMQGGLSVWWFDSAGLSRAFELMDLHSDHPMDLADASLIVAAEMLATRKVFTIDRKDFAAYRVRRGHRHYGLEIIP
jgi:predicted nucleic acid-binding protein